MKNITKFNTLSALLLTSTLVTPYASASDEFLDNKTKKTQSSFSQKVTDKFSQNVGNDINIVWETIKRNPNTIFGEIIDVTINHLAENEIKNHLFQNKDSHLQENVKKIAGQLTNSFVKFIEKKMGTSKNYVEISGNKHYVRSDVSLISSLASLVIPDSVPLKSVVLALLKNSQIESSIQNSLTSYIIDVMENLIKVRKDQNFKEQSFDIFLKSFENTTNTIKDIQAYLNAPSDSKIGENIQYVAQSLFEYLAPYLKQSTREFVSNGMHSAANSIFQTLKKSNSSPRKFSSNILSSGAGFLGLGITSFFTGGMIMPLIGGGLSWYAGGHGGNALFDSSMDHMKEFSHKAIDQIIYKMFGLDKDQYVLNSLNPNPTSIERGLFAEDYALRDELNSKTTVLSILKSMATLSLPELRKNLGVVGQQFYDYFAENKDASVEEAMKDSVLSLYINKEGKENSDKKEQAQRNYYLLSKSERKKIKENLQKYPSYDQKVKQLQEAVLPSLWSKTEVKKEKKENISKTRASKIKDNMFEILNYAENFDMIDNFWVNIEEVLVNEVRHLSKDDQDIFAKLAPDQIKNHVEKISKGKNTSFLIEGEKVNNQAIRECIQDLLVLGEEGYIQKNEQGIKDLKKQSIAEGMSFAEVVKLHKKINENKIEIIENNNEVIENKIEIIENNEKIDYPKSYTEMVKQSTSNILDNVIKDIATTRAHNLFNVFQNYMESIKAKDILANHTSELSEIENENKKIEASANFLYLYMGTTSQNLGHVRDQMVKNFGENQTFKDTLDKEYKDLRTKYIQGLCKQVMNEKKPSFVEVKQTNSILNMFTTSSVKEEKAVPSLIIKQLTQEKILKKVNKQEKNLVEYKSFFKSESTQFNWSAEIINDLSNSKKIVNVSLSDVETSFQNVMQSLQASHVLSTEEKDFVDSYWGEIVGFGEKMKVNKNSLILKVKSLLWGLKSENHKTLEKLFSDKK